MDITKFDVKAAADRGAELHLLHPATDEPLYGDDGKPVTIRLLGKDSREYRAALGEVAEKQVGKKRTTLAAAEAGGIELNARATAGWHNIGNKEGPIKFSVDAARELYHDSPWIKEQVDKFVDDRANFLKFAATK